MIEYCKARILFSKTADEFRRKKRLSLPDLVYWLDGRTGKSELNIIDEILLKSKKNIDNIKKVPNWNKSSSYLLSDCDICFITEDDIGNEVSIFNRFTREYEKYKVVGNKTLKKNEKDGVLIKDYLDTLNEEKKAEPFNPNNQEIKILINDYFAFYVPINGVIFLFIDRIITFAAEKGFDCAKTFLLFEKILLHELIHSCLDLYPRNKGMIIWYPPKWQNNGFNEESIDNAIILQCFKNQGVYPTIEDFILSQPKFYRKSLNFKNKTEIIKYLKKLIKHKLNVPKYFFEGVYYFGIGRLAETILTKIINSENFADLFASSSSHPIHPYILDAKRFNTHRTSSKVNRYYGNPAKSKDGKDVYISSQWWDQNHKNQDLEALNSLVSLFPSLFTTVISII